MQPGGGPSLREPTQQPRLPTWGSQCPFCGCHFRAQRGMAPCPQPHRWLLSHIHDSHPSLQRPLCPLPSWVGPTLWGQVSAAQVMPKIDTPEDGSVAGTTHPTPIPGLKAAWTSGSRTARKGLWPRSLLCCPHFPSEPSGNGTSRRACHRADWDSESIGSHMDDLGVLYCPATHCDILGEPPTISHALQFPGRASRCDQ